MYHLATLARQSRITEYKLTPDDSDVSVVKSLLGALKFLRGGSDPEIYRDINLPIMIEQELLWLIMFGETSRAEKAETAIHHRGSWYANELFDDIAVNNLK